MSPTPTDSFDHEKELAAVGVQEAREINKLNLDADEIKGLDVGSRMTCAALVCELEAD